MGRRGLWAVKQRVVREWASSQMNSDAYDFDFCFQKQF
jgi:hypothetical protein